MPYVEVEKGKLHYIINGSGPSLVLLHSAWATHEWWRWQIPSLSRIYRIYALDLRGHGKSTPLERPYSVAGFATDLKIFLTKLKIEKTVLIGWSLGGIIAMQYCIQNPQQVSALVLIATQGHKNPRLKRQIIAYYFQTLLQFLMDLSQPRKYDRNAQKLPRQTDAWFERQVRSMVSPTAPREVFDWIVADVTNNPRKNYWEVIRSVWNWEAGKKLKQIHVPTLILVGDKDSLTPPSISHRLHAAIPNSKLVIVKDTSHYLVLERPDRVNTEILKFLHRIGY
ncbi:MAG: alpha/beta hydrolase [Deltaproteobacteria bacterium]|nr:MAG: alpha/beta hydrolase [Deltaproteobacteria bacterium]